VLELRSLFSSSREIEIPCHYCATLCWYSVIVVFFFVCMLMFLFCYSLPAAMNYGWNSSTLGRILLSSRPRRHHSALTIAVTSAAALAGMTARIGLDPFSWVSEKNSCRYVVFLPSSMYSCTLFKAACRAAVFSRVLRNLRFPWAPARSSAGGQ